MDPSTCPFLSGGLAIDKDALKTLISPLAYIPDWEQHQHHQQQNQFQQPQFPLLPMHPGSQHYLGLQQQQCFHATSQPIVPPESLSYLPLHPRTGHPQSPVSYQSLSALPPITDLSLVNTIPGYSLPGTGVKPHPATVKSFPGVPVSFNTAKLCYDLHEQQMLSNTSSPTTRATSSQGYRSDSAYATSPYLAPNLDSIPDALFGYPCDTVPHLIGTSNPLSLSSFPDPIAAYSPAFTGNYLDCKSFQPTVLDDDSTSVTAQPVGSTTPVFDYVHDHTEAFCTPIDVDVQDSPLPAADTEAGSQGKKRKQSFEAEDRSTAKRKKAKTQSGKGLGNEKSKEVMARSGNHNLSSSHPFQCPNCACQPFTSRSELDRHSKKHHGQYPCILKFASGSGCGKRFSKKNEWKRHCITQHVVEEYYVCPGLICQGRPNAVFLRKDLFQAHLIRVHTKKSVQDEHKERQAADKKRRDALANSGRRTKRKSAASHKEANDGEESPTAIPFPKIPYSQGYKESCKEHQDLTKNGVRSRVKLPYSIACQFQGCCTVFEGENALNKYLEHVAKYLDTIPGADDFEFGLTLVPYFVGIGILKAKEGTSENEKPEWELATATPEIKVHRDYLPDPKSNTR